MRTFIISVALVLALLSTAGGMAAGNKLHSTARAASAALQHCEAGGWYLLLRDEYLRTQPRVDLTTGRRLRAGLLLHTAGRRVGAWLFVFVPDGQGWVLRANLRVACPPANWRDLLRRAAPPTPTPTPTPTPPPPAPTPVPTPAPVQDTSCAAVECAPLDAIHWAALRWGASEAALDGVMRCESGGNISAYNPSGASGLFQFMPPTFWAYALSAGESRSYWTASGSSDVAAYMFAQGQARQWVCAYLTGVVVGGPRIRTHLAHLPSYCHPPLYKTPPSCWSWLPMSKRADQPPPRHH